MDKPITPSAPPFSEERESMLGPRNYPDLVLVAYWKTYKAPYAVHKIMPLFYLVQNRYVEPHAIAFTCRMLCINKVSGNLTEAPSCLLHHTSNWAVW